MGGQSEYVTFADTRALPNLASQIWVANSTRRIEHRFQLARRATDDLEHIGGGSLLLQRFAQLARALLFGFKQPHILDSNQRLIGECLQQLNLPI